MVRYIKHGELVESSVICHYQVPGAKHGVRRYQYPDGTYTPLGREHYGIGVKKDRTKLEKLRDTTRAAVDTAKGYRVIRKQEKKARKEQQLENRKQAYRVAEEMSKKTAEGLRKLNADRIAGKLKERSDKQSAKDRDKQVKGKKDDKFDRLTNDELMAYTNRLNLETNARQAETASKLQKMGAPFEVIKQLSNYGETAIRAYDTLNSMKNALNKNRNTVVSPSQVLAQNLVDKALKDFAANDYDAAKTLGEMKPASLLEALTKLQTIEALSKK